MPDRFRPVLSPTRVQRCNSAEEESEVVQLFERIAREEGWHHGGELHDRAVRSTYFASKRGNHLVGGVQIVAPDERGHLPTHRVWPELPGVDRLTQHASALAVLPEFRGKDHADAFWSLGAALWRHSVEHQVRTLWLEATPKMLRCYRLLGWPLVVLGEERLHWGEPCIPCALSVREIGGSIAERAVRSATYRRILAKMTDPPSPISNP